MKHKKTQNSQETKPVLTPAWVASMFEHAFINVVNKKPSQEKLEKKIEDLGMDSLDCIDVVMELENKAQIKIPGTLSGELNNASLYHFLDKFVRALVENNRLSPADAKIVMTQYSNLLQKKLNFGVSTLPIYPALSKKNLDSVPTALLQEYKQSVIRTKELQQEIMQYIK